MRVTIQGWGGQGCMYLCAVHTCTKQKQTWNKLLCTYNLLMIFMLLPGLFQWTSENTKTDIQINHWKKRKKSKLFAFPYLTKWNQNIYFCCHSIFNFLWIRLPPTLAHSHYIKTSANTKMINQSLFHTSACNFFAPNHPFSKLLRV